MHEATWQLFGLDSAHIFAYEPLITLFNIPLQSLVFVDRSRGATMHTRGPPDPLEPQAQSPPWTAAVTLQWWQTTMRTATLEVVSTHSTNDTVFVHLNCQIVNIRLGVFVYSRFLRRSVHTQYVCQPVCVCSYILYVCVCHHCTAGDFFYRSL